MGGKTLEGEETRLKAGFLSLQASLTFRELSPCPRHLRSGILFRFFEVAGTWGKFLVFWGGAGFLPRAAIALFL